MGHPNGQHTHLYHTNFSVTPSNEAVHDNFEKELEHLFDDVKFSNESIVEADDLETMLNVDKDHLDCEMSREYLEKLLDVQKYQDV